MKPIVLHDDDAIDAYYKKDREARLASVKKDKTVPKVGDIVRFNDTGLRQVFGSATGKSFMKKLELRITFVASESMTYPEPTFVVEVDDPEINQFLIDHCCFDIVRRA
jgi:hypothetical protein